MTDEAGGDEKIIAVPTTRLTPRYSDVHNYTDLQEMTWRRIEHFFLHYKDLEPNKWANVAGWGDAADARACIAKAIAKAAEKK
jgi:inorganic pyrophosphatase